MDLISYGLRAQTHPTHVGRKLLSLMHTKQTNLCVSVDLTKKADFLKVVEAVGDEVCLIKTHIDIVDDFDPDLIIKLQALSEKYNFMIFEDRKFADIGSTAHLQYTAGIYKIASWSHFTNAHCVPGPSIISSLATAGLPLNRGLLLLAEMSSVGSLAIRSYTSAAVQMARDERAAWFSKISGLDEDAEGVNQPFAAGFIAGRRVEDVFRPVGGQAVPSGPSSKYNVDDFLIMTPGVGMDVVTDGKGQQYRTPQEVIYDCGSDVAIVGRGIYGGGKGMDEVRLEAARYRKACWAAYLQRTLPK